MKKILFFMVVFLVSFIQAFAQVQNIEINFRGEKSFIPIAVIDSITHENDGISYNQFIWNKGYKCKINVNDIEQVSFPKEDVSYNNFAAKEHGIENGIINSLGQYAAIGKDSISNNGAVIIIGDINKSEPQIIVHVDSLKLIRYVYCDSIVCRYFYGEKDFTILTLNENGDSLNCETYTYSQLQQFQTKARSATRTGGTISNSGWFNLFTLIDMSKSIKGPNGGLDDKSLLSNWVSMQYNPLLSFGGDIAGFIMGNLYARALILLKWFDNIWNFWVFRGASIVTLPHEELKIDAVRLGCQITGLNKIPKIRNFEAYTVCSMKMRAISGYSGADPDEYMRWKIQERNVNSDGIQNFEFSNLLLESQYEYYPQLNLAWTEAQASAWVELSDDIMPDIEDWTVVTEEHKSFQSIRGDKGSFFTTKPSATTEKPYYVYATNATVGCSFYNVPNNALCGIEYSDGSQVKSISVSNKEGESFPVINGLQPNTTYTYRAFVQTKYKKYYGKKKTFTTKYPSCSTGELVSKTDKSAVIKCYYTDVEDDGFECGVVISSDNNTRKISTSSTEGKHEIPISGLSPATTYNYWAYVDIDGEIINGEVKSFTTNLPDISGTWSCTETYYLHQNYDNPQYKSYPIVLNKNGTVSIDGKSDYISSSWQLRSDGTLNIDITDAMIGDWINGIKFYLEVDDIKNPTKITGARCGWSVNNTVGYIERGGNPVVLTR